MSRNSKILSGLFSFLPIILVIGLFIIMFLQFATLGQWEDADRSTGVFPNIMSYFFILILVIFLLSIGLLIYFIIHLVNNKKADSTEKAVWILAFVLGGMISYPIYWYMKIWREDV